MRFGLYEPPAITLQKSGVYAPKTGLLGKLGFSSVEAALIRKDLRAFTRRRELIGVYFMPIIIVILSIFYSFGITRGGSPNFNKLWSGVIFLVPASGMAMLLGQVLIGEEGQAVWRIYASPISAKNLVKSKFFLTIIFSVIILIVTGFIGILFFHPSLRKTIIAMVEAFFIAVAVASVSLQIGFKGPDFSGTRRARMVRQEWSLIGLYRRRHYRSSSFCASACTIRFSVTFWHNRKYFKLRHWRCSKRRNFNRYHRRLLQNQHWQCRELLRKAEV